MYRGEFNLNKSYNLGGSKRVYALLSKNLRNKITFTKGESVDISIWGQGLSFSFVVIG